MFYLGYNSRINKMLVTPKPNLWKFIEHMQREENNMVINFERLGKNLLKSSGQNKKDIQFDLDLESS